MSEVNQSAATTVKGKVKRKKSSTHIDMTPMVDLAFLLLTFFMLTASFMKLNVVDIIMPQKTAINTKVNYRNVITLYPSSDNKLFVRKGLDKDVQAIAYGANGLDALLKANQKNPDFFVIIKPADNSKYSNLVDIMDEVNKLKVPHYCIQNIDQQEKQQLAQL